MNNRRITLKSVALAAALAIGAAACSSSAGLEVTAATAVPTVAGIQGQAQTPVVPTTAPADQAPVGDEPEADTAAPADGAAGAGTVDIVFDDGRTWTLNTVMCKLEPESAFGVFFMEGTSEAGAVLTVVESWPLSGDRSKGTAFIATFLDEDLEVYTLAEAEVQQVGDALSFTTGIYEGVFATETTLTGTFTCTP